MAPVDGSKSSVLKCKVRTVTSKNISIITTNSATALTVTQPTAATAKPNAKKPIQLRMGLDYYHFNLVINTNN